MFTKGLNKARSLSRMATKARGYSVGRSSTRRTSTRTSRSYPFKNKRY